MSGIQNSDWHQKFASPSATKTSCRKYTGERSLSRKHQKFFSAAELGFWPQGRGMFEGNFPIRENCSQEVDNIVHQIKYCCHERKLSKDKITTFFSASFRDGISERNQHIDTHRPGWFYSPPTPLVIGQSLLTC